jgi:hypothetical protein
VGLVGHSAGLRGGVRDIFLRSSSIRPTLSVTRERLPHTGTARRKRTLSVRGLTGEAYVSYWSSFPLQSVY